MNLSINAIYPATEGEGVWIGHPQVFVRFQGCHVGCLNCDSKDTWDFDTGHSMELEAVLESVYDKGYGGKLKRVSITGGDPLHPKLTPQVKALAKELKKRGYWLNIEAAGTRIDDELFKDLDYISFDIKTPSTGVKTSKALLEKMYCHYLGKFQIKAVIETQEDFAYVSRIYDSFDWSEEVSWVLTPAYNLLERFPQERMLKVIELNQESGGRFRVIGQQHKFLHGPDKVEI